MCACGQEAWLRQQRGSRRGLLPCRGQASTRSQPLPTRGAQRCFLALAESLKPAGAPPRMATRHGRRAPSALPPLPPLPPLEPPRCCHRGADWTTGRIPTALGASQRQTPLVSTALQVQHWIVHLNNGLMFLLLQHLSRVGLRHDALLVRPITNVAVAISAARWTASLRNKD